MKDKNNKKSDNSNDSENIEIPGMNLDKYKMKNLPGIPGMSQDPSLPSKEDQEKIKKEMDEKRQALDKLKNQLTKKFNYIEAIGILPPQSIKIFIEEEEVPKETEKLIHLVVIIPEEKFKEVKKIKEEMLKVISESSEKFWLHLITPVDIWELSLDSKFDLAASIAMSFPLYDKGILGALRVAEIHKSLVLRKFEKYVVSYVIAGSLVRGEAVKTSDVDVFIVINDTDVKRMPRLELKEKLRAIIYQYIGDATSLAGVKNVLNVQVYLLTDFWESVKDAHPVIFTFIRDGVPLYDRGTFMPWKALLKMGKLKPSPESIDMFMSMGDKVEKRVKRTLLDLVLGDIYWGVLTPSQALLMLYGLPPPNVKETVKEMKNVFVDKEKMLEKKYIDILEKICIKYYKGYEHEKIKEISGKEVDELLKDMNDYLKRLKELREQIEKRASEKTIEQIYEDAFKLLEILFNGKHKEEKAVEEFDKQFIKKGIFAPYHLRILKEIVSARKEFKKGKLDVHKVDQARKEASILINAIIEHNQRLELSNKVKEEKK